MSLSQAEAIRSCAETPLTPSGFCRIGNAFALQNSSKRFVAPREISSVGVPLVAKIAQALSLRNIHRW